MCGMYQIDKDALDKSWCFNACGGVQQIREKWNMACGQLAALLQRR